MTFLFITSIVLFSLGAISGFFFRRNPKTAQMTSFGFAIAASLVGVIFSLSALNSSAPFEISFSSVFSAPLFSFFVDRLSAFFILLTSSAGVMVSIFALGYLAHGKYSGTRTALMGFLYNLFLCSMILVAGADNIITFLVVWELMSILSYFLVTYEHEKSENLKAGFLYIVMTQAGTVFLMTAFFFLFKETGSFQFSDFRTAGALLPELVKNIVFVTALIGFGVKAGLVPFHIWLPEAHPAAPAHVSALMSGIMIKIAIYGLLRFVLSFMGGGEVVWWWGVAIMILGSLSAVAGALYAIMEKDIKRFLAYSSIENIGIIFIGIGSALIFVSGGYWLLVGLALSAVFYHILSHSIFKILLFMGAGAIYSATGLKNMEKLGGLAKAMPFTAVFFLVGAMAMSALPFLAGFVSEWLIFQSLLSNLFLASIGIKIIVSIAVALLALTSALALAASVRVFGISFLALPRSPEAAGAKEVSRLMLLGLSIPATFCFIFGLFPILGLSIINPVLESLGIVNLSAASAFSIFPIYIFPFGISPIAAAFLFGGVILAVNFIAILIWGKHKKRKSPTWACGRAIEPYMEYTATGLAMPFRLVFSSIYRPTHNIERETLDGTGYLVKTVSYEEKIEPLFEKYIYRPIVWAVEMASAGARKIHTGNINLYLGYILATLVLLLLIFV